MEKKKKKRHSFPGAPGRAVVRLSRHPFDAASLAAPGGSNEDEEQEENDDDDDGGGGGGKERASKKVKTQTGGLLGAKLRLAKTMRNDIYGKYSGDFLPSPSLLEAAGAGLVVDVTYPATEKHIAKQRAQRRVMLLETSELFEKVTSPLVEAIPPNRVAWVENILEGKAEVDRVMARNERNGWVLLPDMKWDHRKADAAIAELKKLEGEREKGDEGEGGDSRAALAAASDREKAAKESFYAQLIFRDKGLKSLRDIDGESAPRVAAAVAAAFDFIKTHYGIPRSSLRAFFHYHPSYWRLHVHFCGPQVFPDDSAGRAHLVEDVLEAVRAQPRWWRERALSVRSFRGDDLAEALIAAGGEQ